MRSSITAAREWLLGLKTVIGGVDKEIDALLAATEATCTACNGLGVVGGPVGQTPETFDCTTEDCPCCGPTLWKVKTWPSGTTAIQIVQTANIVFTKADAMRYVTAGCTMVPYYPGKEIAP